MYILHLKAILVGLVERAATVKLKPRNKTCGHVDPSKMIVRPSLFRTKSFGCNVWLGQKLSTNTPFYDGSFKLLVRLIIYHQK